MKSNGTKMGALRLAQIATILGAVVWAAGLFSNYAIIPFRGLYLFFAVMSVVQLVLSLKIAGISRETEGDPLKTSVRLYHLLRPADPLLRCAGGAGSRGSALGKIGRAHV